MTSCLTCLNVFEGIFIDPQEFSLHYSAFFYHFLCPPQWRCSFWPRFSMMQRPSISHAIDERYFFHHNMSVMIFPEFCNQKFDKIRWCWRTIHENACEKFSIFFYIVNKPYKRIFNWMVTYLLITLTWNNRGFGVLGYWFRYHR